MRRLYTFYFALLMLPMIFLSIETGWAQQETFSFTNGQQSFVVPNGVTSVHIEAWGAEGASIGTVGAAGLGGFAEGDLAVTPGQTLGIFVGGQGCAQSAQVLGCGGFNGGGDARGAIIGDPRGAGGGASDVRVGGTSLNDRMIVAAGGGGACNSSNDPGGNGGGLIGSPGGSSQAGGGGTQTTGGQGFSSPNCLSGVFGFGGDAGTGTCAGGGGGWFGGGSGCGGGGGSSFIDGVDNGTTTSGVREGDGLVVLSWMVTEINLSPATATNDIRADHTVTATVETDGVPEPDVLVTFEVISGPNAGLVSMPNNGECTTNDDCTTDVNGQVSWTYSSFIPGTDIIVASAFSDEIESNIVEKIWVLPPTNIPTLSEWGLIAMAGILGIVGFMVIRRRKLRA